MAKRGQHGEQRLGGGGMCRRRHGKDGLRGLCRACTGEPRRAELAHGNGGLCELRGALTGKRCSSPRRTELALEQQRFPT